MSEQSTKHKEPNKEPKVAHNKVVHGVVHKTMHKVDSAARSTGKWLWERKRPILTNAAWLVAGTMIGAVRVIPPPAKFIKLGLFRIGTG